MIIIMLCCNVRIHTKIRDCTFIKIVCIMVIVSVQLTHCELHPISGSVVGVPVGLMCVCVMLPVSLRAIQME